MNHPRKTDRLIKFRRSTRSQRWIAMEVKYWCSGTWLPSIIHMWSTSDSMIRKRNKVKTVLKTEKIPDKTSLVISGWSPKSFTYLVLIIFFHVPWRVSCTNLHQFLNTEQLQVCTHIFDILLRVNSTQNWKFRKYIPLTIGFAQDS